MSLSVFWFRRDLRLHDNHGLSQALKSKKPVLCIFIFDQNILSKLKNKKDARVEFIYKKLTEIKLDLEKKGSSLLVFHSTPRQAFLELTSQFPIDAVYTNNDYEPYAKIRDKEISDFLKSKSISFFSFKDQVIFEKNEIVKDNQEPYTVYTPYMKKWLKTIQPNHLKTHSGEGFFYSTAPFKMLSMEQLGFEPSSILFPPSSINEKILQNYAQQRDYPYKQATSLMGIHLRFGTISIREMVQIAQKQSATWLSELIWREFFMQILWHFPDVYKNSFRKEYDYIQWLNSPQDFQAWCDGLTGYPLVDAGMRELNQTGHMHNRVRMVTASFLTKHLLVDWRKGERYFAEKLLDYDLSANNGNWQWAAGCGCDAAPYFRVFNPTLQQEKFDPHFDYIKKWVPEYGTDKYVKPIIDHDFARKRALLTYKKGLGKISPVSLDTGED